MRLPEKDIYQFYSLYHSLLVYANKKYSITTIESPGDVFITPFEEIEVLKNKLYEHPGLIQEFVEENPCDFSSDQLTLISEWKTFLKGEFVIYRQLKKFCVFLDVEESKAYGVLALLTPFGKMVELPINVTAVLLPFKGKIIYDGTFRSHPFTGRGFRQRCDNAYQVAKFRYGIITSLPFTGGEKSDEDTLKFYLKSGINRYTYWEEIQELIHNNPTLVPLYYQQLGKLASRKAKEILQDVGLSRGWIATLEGLFIAAGSTRKEVEKVVEKKVPEEKREYVYYHQSK
jgi:hypothetical protein